MNLSRKNASGSCDASPISVPSAKSFLTITQTAPYQFLTHRPRPLSPCLYQRNMLSHNQGPLSQAFSHLGNGPSANGSLGSSTGKQPHPLKALLTSQQAQSQSSNGAKAQPGKAPVVFIPTKAENRE